jgi:hypothetical protein
MRSDIIRTCLRPAWSNRQARTFEDRLIKLGWEAVEGDNESVVYQQPVTARRCIVTRFDRERSARPMLTLTTED